MINELKFLVLDYSKKDLPYINELCSYLEKNCASIVQFFDIKNFGEKVNVKLWDSLTEFRKYYEKLFSKPNAPYVIPKWVCGFANNNDVHTLTFSEFVKTKSNEDPTFDDLKKTVMHEFVHACQKKIDKFGAYAWITEGLAVTLSGQYENVDVNKLKFDATLNEMQFGCSNYTNYFLMFNYVYKTYGKNHIFKLIKNINLQKTETEKLFNETKNYYAQGKSK